MVLLLLLCWNVANFPIWSSHRFGIIPPECFLGWLVRVRIFRMKDYPNLVGDAYLWTLIIPISSVYYFIFSFITFKWKVDDRKTAAGCRCCLAMDFSTAWSYSSAGLLCSLANDWLKHRWWNRTQSFRLTDHFPVGVKESGWKRMPEGLVAIGFSSIV